MFIQLLIALSSLARAKTRGATSCTWVQHLFAVSGFLFVICRLAMLSWCFCLGLCPPPSFLQHQNWGPTQNFRIRCPCLLDPHLLRVPAQSSTSTRGNQEYSFERQSVLHPEPQARRDQITAQRNKQRQQTLSIRSGSYNNQIQQQVTQDITSTTGTTQSSHQSANKGRSK